MSETTSWFREIYEEAKRRNALIPEFARMIVTNPALSAHRRPVRQPEPPADVDV